MIANHARRHARRISVCLLAIALGPPAHAQTSVERVVFTDWGRVERLHSAWSQDAVGINHSAPFVNSKRLKLSAGLNGQFSYVDACTVKNDGYATDPADPGHKLHHAILLGAFLHGKEVRLTLQGCAFDRPRIIGVEVR